MIRSPITVCWWTNAHLARRAAAPACRRIASGIATLPTSCSSATWLRKPRSWSASPRLPPDLDGQLGDVRDVVDEDRDCAPASARISTSLLWLPADERRCCFCAYMRESASRRAALVVAASWGSEYDSVRARDLEAVAAARAGERAAAATAASSAPSGSRGGRRTRRRPSGTRLRAGRASAQLNAPEPVEQRVAREMTVRVVVALEAVEV